MKAHREHPGAFSFLSSDRQLLTDTPKFIGVWTNFSTNVLHYLYVWMIVQLRNSNIVEIDWVKGDDYIMAIGNVTGNMLTVREVGGWASTISVR